MRSTKLLALHAGLFLAARLAGAQVPVAVGGHVLGPDSIPLRGAEVTATAAGATGSYKASTDAQGAYRIVIPTGGDRLIIHAALATYAPQQRTVIRQPGDTGALRVDFQLVAQRAQALAAVKVIGRHPRPPRSDVVRGEVGTQAMQSSAVDLNGLQTGNPSADLASTLATIPGLTLVPDPNGGPPGISAFGLAPDQNSVTLNGMTIDPASVPLYGSMAQVSLGSFDPGQRGGSGAHVSFAVPRGVNYAARSLRVALDHPWLQSTDPIAPGNGGRYTQSLVSGIVSGPIIRDHLFYNVLVQANRRSSDLVTLASAQPATLQGLGLSADSAARALAVARALGIPVSTGAVPDEQLTTSESFFARLDWDRDSNTTAGLSLNGTRSDADQFAGPTALPATGRGAGSWSLRMTPSLSRYFFGGAMLNETSVALSTSSSHSRPYLASPGAQVRIDSRLSDGTAGSAGVLLGGSSGGVSDNGQSSAQLRSVTSWLTLDKRHLFEVTLDGELRRSRSELQPGLGVFVFNSLADLEAVHPASFSRTLGAETHALTDASWLVGGSDRYSPFDGLALRYGVQLQGAVRPTRPAYNPRVETLFGRRTDQVPDGVAWSPMLSFDWTVGTLGPRDPSARVSRSRFGTISGNVARRRGVIGAAMVDGVARSTGLPGSLGQLTCTGVAAPVFDWDASSADGAMMLAPTACADGTGASPLTQETPPVALFAPDFTAPLTWDTNLGWRRGLGRSFYVSLGLTYRRSTNLPGVLDLNFDSTTRFRLPGEEDRPVYVSPASIDPTTGAVAVRESRRADEFSRVNEYRANLASDARQLRVGLSGRLPPAFGITVYGSVNYAYLQLRQRTNAFNGGTTARDPRVLAWEPSPDARHQISVSADMVVRNWFGFSVFGAFRSPTSFTPVVGGDINGDGYANDQAFVFRPDNAATDAVIAHDMTSLLATNPAAARCLGGQLGTIARRNSCTGDHWTSQFNLQVYPGRDGFAVGERTRVSFGVTNVLGAFDRLLHGADGLHGWGQGAQGQTSDPRLLYVRGFDPATQRFRYSVNPNFASDATARTLSRAPFRITLLARMRFGRSGESIHIIETLRPRASDSTTVLSLEQIADRVAPARTTPLQALLLLRDSLQLSDAQVDSIVSLDHQLNAARDAIYRALAAYLAPLAGNYDSPATRLRWRQATTDAEHAWLRLAPATQALLTAEQRQKLPVPLRLEIEASARAADRLPNQR